MQICPESVCSVLAIISPVVDILVVSNACFISPRVIPGASNGYITATTLAIIVIFKEFARTVHEYTCSYHT